MTSTGDSAPAEAAPRAPRAPRALRAPGLPRSLAAHPAFGPLPGLLLILTVVTGVVDSISILALGRVFVANMTGNVVFAGFAIVGAPGFSLSASLFALAAVLATAMGIQNAVARKLAVPDLTTTVLTMTLTGIGADLTRRLLAIGTMLAGALAGASLTLYVSPVSALALALSLLAVTAAAAAAAATRPALWRTPPPKA